MLCEAISKNTVKLDIKPTLWVITTGKCAMYKTKQFDGIAASHPHGLLVVASIELDAFVNLPQEDYPYHVRHLSPGESLHLEFQTDCHIEARIESPEDARVERWRQRPLVP